MIRSLVFRLLYWYLNRIDIHHQVTFMNYGYSEKGKIVPLKPEDEHNRASLQLYHHLAEMADLTNKDIIDIGSGRGGGLSYIARTWDSLSSRGIDKTKDSIDFSNRQHKHKNLTFLIGNANNLPIDDNSCDVVFNVESSHRYESMETFLKEVMRVMRSDGCFLFTDFRYDWEWDELNILFKESGLEIISENDITSNILLALQIDSSRRIMLIKKYSPRILQKLLLNFSGAPGSKTYDNFVTRKYVYRSYKLQKIA